MDTIPNLNSEQRAMPSIPALVQILIIFLAVVVAAGRKVHLGLAAALGGVALALWRGLDPLSVARSVATEALRADTLLLVVLMSWIMAFSAAMKRSGAMASLSSTLVELMPSPRVAMAVAPLLIGTLPMPGGAILSAPLVDAMDPDRTRGADVLSAANFWFRHGLELAWPLYPAFILTSSLSGVSSGRLIALNAYALPLLFLLGLVFILPAPRRGTNKAGGDATGAAPEGPARRPLAPRIRAFSAAVAPLALVLGVYVALDAL
jgi:hypothetical protein